MKLTSKAFQAGEAIPRRFTCEGEDQSPPLAWSEVPEAARSLLLLCDDPDAPGGVWHHWGLFDIPANSSGLPEGFPPGAHDGRIRQARNDFRLTAYGGPCPPVGHGRHHYHFRLLALDIESLGLPDGTACEKLEAAARDHVLETAELIGVFSR